VAWGCHSQSSRPRRRRRAAWERTQAHGWSPSGEGQRSRAGRAVGVRSFS
jgi:hypothetical protein